MNKEFVPYAEALALKELGFDEPCFGRYYYKESYHMLNPNSGETELVFEFGQYIKQTEITILAPTFSQAFRWFREKYNLLSEIGLRDREDLSTWKFEITIIGKYEMKHNSISYNTHEEAELACLIKLIEIVK
jgi:hypothetical protein